MNTNKKHRGVVVPMVTPFTRDGLVDVGGVERLVDRLASNGLGIFVLGTTGEASSIPDDQRRILVETAVKTAAGRTRVYAGIGDNCVAHSIESGREYLSLGVDGLVAHLPSYYLLKDSEMEEFFRLLARELRRDVLLYNMPQTTHMSIPLEVVDRLSRLPEIVGYKDSENCAGRPETCAQMLGGRADFSIFMGVALLSSKALKLGFDGLVPSSGNLVPSLWRKLWQSAQDKNWDSVDALQLQVDAVAQVFQKGRTLGQSLAALKGCLAAEGVCEPAMLPPFKGLERNECNELGALLSSLVASAKG